MSWMMWIAAISAMLLHNWISLIFVMNLIVMYVSASDGEFRTAG